MRKLVVAFTSVLVLGGFAMTSPAAWANHDLDDFTVYAKITDFDKEDNGKEGWSKGDKVSFEADLYESRRERAGDAAGTCELLEINRDDDEFEAKCRVVLDLDDGELKVGGTIDEDDFDGGELTLPITGGTGDYEDADGDVTFEPLRYHGHGHGKDKGHGKGHGHDGAPILKVSVDFH